MACVLKCRSAFVVFAVLFAVAPLFVFANGGDAGHAHEEDAVETFHEEEEVAEGLVVSMTSKPPLPAVGTTTALTFFVHERPGEAPVPFSSLDIAHTKLMHVAGVRSDLEEFFHIHPTPAAEGNFTVPYIFEKPGVYKIWSEIKKDGEEHVFGHPELDVSGVGARSEKAITLGRNVVVGDDGVGRYQVFLDAPERLPEGRTHDFTFDVHTATGEGVWLGNFLGAKMHLTAVKDGFGQFIHGHPEGGDHHASSESVFARIAEANGSEAEAVESEKVNFHLTLPEAGLYKVFVEFRPAGAALPEGEALAAGFWVNIGEDVIDPRAQWWILLVASLILMSILSFIVHRYISKE